MGRARENTVTVRVGEREWLQDGEGNRYGEGTVATFRSVDVELWTNGESGMFGPRDGIERCVGIRRVSEEWTLEDGTRLVGPCRLIVTLPGAIA